MWIITGALSAGIVLSLWFSVEPPGGTGTLCEDNISFNSSATADCTERRGEPVAGWAYTIFTARGWPCGRGC